MKCRNMNVGLRMYLEQAQHNPVAAYNAALLLENEHMGQAIAQQFYVRAAQGGYVPAMWKVAGLFITGQYVSREDSIWGSHTQDLSQGFAWIRTAAKTGDSTANYLLARCYWDGIGVERNRSSALYFLEQVTFPENSMNPYEPTEVLIFGSVSADLKNNAVRIQKRKSLTPAG